MEGMLGGPGGPGTTPPGSFGRAGREPAPACLPGLRTKAMTRPQGARKRATGSTLRGLEHCPLQPNRRRSASKGTKRLGIAQAIGPFAIHHSDDGKHLTYGAPLQPVANNAASSVPPAASRPCCGLQQLFRLLAGGINKSGGTAAPEPNFP